jgi:hypothetical protein
LVLGILPDALYEDIAGPIGYTSYGAKKMRWQRPRYHFAIAVAVVVASLQWGIPAQASDHPDNLSPAALVRAVVANEVAASNNGSVKHMFRGRKQTPRGSQTKLYVQTTEATAGLLIANDDKPLSEQQLQNETAHLEHLATDRDDLRRKQKQEHEDAEHALRIIEALPDAFDYEFDGIQPGRGVGKVGDELVRLKFRPHPHYSPPSRVEQVLLGMEGYLLIDKNACRLAKIEATLFREVTFGWGILGHLDKGGTFLVEQADVGDGTWEVTHMRLDFTGKIMMVKHLAIKSEEAFSDFRRVPDDLTFAKGVELLKTEQARLQRGETATATASRRRR